MYQSHIHRHLVHSLENSGLLNTGFDLEVKMRFSANICIVRELFFKIYGDVESANEWYEKLLDTIITAHKQRSDVLKELDQKKETSDYWYLSNDIAGMSLYVDRFCGNLKNLTGKLDYFKELGLNFLHLMPIMQSPEEASDGGYAVADFRQVDARFGSTDDLRKLDDKMKESGFYLMLDIVLNHTSNQHIWAKKASSGDKTYQDYFYMYDDRVMPDLFERAMPDIFPDSSPGSFSFDEESGKWVMTVFNNFQWDLNYTNPAVFIEMLDTIFFYGNLGVDVLRIDAPAFIWKTIGTSCQNQPQAHLLLQLIKHCVQIPTPGMALLGEAIVAPKEIMKYFGTGRMTGRECDVAYNATQMALQWDALATGDISIMHLAQHDIQQKPYGATWINYSRCHDDIGLGYEDGMIQQAGYNPYEHRSFIKNYYAGNTVDSVSKGALFGVNPKTNDARISGSLASLCGLEYGVTNKNMEIIKQSVDKILLMQAQSILLGGIPMLFYGDECGYTNDYSYLKDEGKYYDNRWMHRPIINWKKNSKRNKKDSIEHFIFSGIKKLLSIRKSNPVFSDLNNILWLNPHNRHVAGYIRYNDVTKIFCLFNFSPQDAYLTWFAIKETGLPIHTKLHDLYSGDTITVGEDHEYVKLKPYQVLVLQEV